MILEYCAKRIDEHLPALDGATPRKSVVTGMGRRKLHYLVRGLENLERHQAKEGRRSLATAEIRRPVGLTEE